MKYTSSALVCGTLLLSCTATSITTYAESEQSESDTSASDISAEETGLSPVEAVNDDNYDIPFDQNKQYSARDYLDPFTVTRATEIWTEKVRK